jgi:hypothetical protein
MFGGGVCPFVCPFVCLLFTNSVNSSTKKRSIYVRVLSRVRNKRGIKFDTTRRARIVLSAARICSSSKQVPKFTVTRTMAQKRTQLKAQAARAAAKKRQAARE